MATCIDFSRIPGYRKQHLYYTDKNSDFVLLKTNFEIIGCHSLLWPEPITFEKSQRIYSRPKDALFVRDIYIEIEYILTIAGSNILPIRL